MARARSVVGRWGFAAVVALALGCDSSSPTAPSATHEPAAGGLRPTQLAESSGPGEVLPIASAPDGSTLKAGAPTAESPIGDELVDDSLMPTLTVVNADGTFVGSDFDYRFEVHTRDGGSALVATIGANAALSHAGTVAGGADGRTSYTVPTPLEEGVALQWRARAERDGRYGPWSAWGLFQTPVLAAIDAPTALDPVNGSSVFELRPVLQVGNGDTTGDVGTVAMTFVIATDSQFASVVETVTQNAGDHDLTFAPTGAGRLGTFHLRAQRTSVRPTEDLPFETTIHWYAQAASEDGRVVSDRSAVFTFTTAAEGGASGADEVSLSGVNWLHWDISGWPVTSNLTSITFGSVCLDHSMRGGWPAISAGGTIVEGNPVVLYWDASGQAHAGTYEWNRPGQICTGSITADTIGDHIKTPPGNTFKPKNGEQVCFAQATPHRFGPQGPKQERSQFKCTGWGQNKTFQ